MDKSGISDEDFRQLLMDVSGWYDQRDYLNMLKVLYRDHVENTFALNNASDTRDLLSLLYDSGNLSPTDLTILYDTIKATGQFALERKIKDQISSCPNIREIVISKFSFYRQKIMKFGLALNLNDVAKISGLQNMPVKKYTDSWSMIMDLEYRMEICEETIDEFTEKLRKNELHRALDALCRMDLYPFIYYLLVFGIIFGIMAIPEPSIDDVIREYLTVRQKKLYDNVTTMTPPTWNNEYEIDITQVFTELDLLKYTRGDERQQSNPASKEREAKSTTLEKLLGVIKSTDACKMLITGEGGMGKTTILNYIAHSWATNSDDTFTGKILFLVNIRDIKEGENFLDAIIQKINIKLLSQKKNLSKDSIESFLIMYDYEIVLLLDGFDELQAGAENPIKLFEDNALKYTMILTSRPENTIDFLKSCDVHVKVRGFNPISIMNYIHKHFFFFNKADLGETLIQALKLDSEYERDWGGDHKEAFELCSSPYLLLMICTMWREKQHIPKDLPELYKEVFCTILNQYIKRSGKGTTISQFDRIPKKYKSAMLTLGECMYTGFLVNKISIDRYDMKPEESDKTIVDLALDIGFVYKEKSEAEYDLKEIYTTPHKLLSEALAGFYLSIKSQEEYFEDDEHEIIRSSEYLHMTRVFAIGFLGSNAGKLFKKWLIIRASNYYSLAMYFKYVKTEHEQTVLQTLNENMSPEMKEHVENMTNSFRVYIYGKDTINNNEHLIQLIRTFCDAIENKHHRFSMNVSTIVESSDQPPENICRMIVHISLILQVKQSDPYSGNENCLLKIVRKWGDEAIKIISNEWEKHNLNDELHSFSFSDYDSRVIGWAQLHKVLEIVPKLNNLYMRSCNLSWTIINAVINACQNSSVLLEVRTLDISHNNLDDIDVASFCNLLKMAHKLEILNMEYCNVTGTMVGNVLNKCDGMGVVLKDNMFGLKGNNLSSIDGESIVKLVNLLYSECDPLIWSDYTLSADNLQDLVNSCADNCRFTWCAVDLSDTDLSSFSITTLAKFLKIFPDLVYLNMGHCNLTGTIIAGILKVCDVMNVSLKDKMIGLKGNDLSSIDGESLVKLVNILYIGYGSLKWSDYNLSADNLHYIVNSCAENCRFKWSRVDFSNINLSLVSGTTLANLYKIFPELIYLNLRNCNLTGSIVGDMMNECDRIGVVLKENMLRLEGNDLSNIDGESLATLVNVISYETDLYELFLPQVNYRRTIKWSDYQLSADNLQDIVNCKCAESCRFKLDKLDLSDIDLYSINGSTFANFLKLFSNLTRLDMRNCNLTDKVIGDVVNECDNMGILLYY